MVAQPLTTSPSKPPRVAFYSRDFEDVQRDRGVRSRPRAARDRGRAPDRAASAATSWRRGWRRRVGRLERAARQVARGRFMEPLPVTSKDELGQLTETFNQMQQQLRRVDVARKEFIATASHELRTPIFSLGGFVELLQDEDLDEDTRREFLETMSEQVERLQKLSVNLLDLSRLDSGSVELHTEPVDLAELTRSIAGEFHPRLAEHGTELVLDVPEEGPSASCDRERVAQIMRILLDNALRHTPEGTDVTVSAHRYNGAAELTVADSGPRPAGRRARQGVRALLHRRRGARRRARARHRTRAGRAHGRPAGALARERRHGVHARAARRTVTAREDAAAAAARRRGAAPWRRAATRTATTASAAPAGGRARSRPRACRWSRGSAARAASTRPRSTTGSRPAWSRSCRSSTAAPACSRTAARAARAPASCSTATATSPRTRTW